MGLVSKPKIADYWKTIGPTKTPEFGKITARNKFQSIRAFIYFADYITIKKSEMKMDMTDNSKLDQLLTC